VIGPEPIERNERQLMEALVYDARAPALWHEETDLLIDPVRPPFPNREQVDFLAFALAHLAPLEGKRILEVGCGSGALATHLALRGASVTAIDVSHEMLRVATRRAEVNGVGDRVSWRDVPVESFSMDDSPYDAVIGNQVLHHVAIPAAMRNIARVLAPGGVAVFCEPVLFIPEVFRSFRNSRPVTRLFPERTDTSGERSLSMADARTVTRPFSISEMHPFQLSCRLQNFVELSDRTFAGLERVDRFVLAHVRTARRLCRYIVFILRSPILDEEVER
jgi:2-polyprenyl-3-methyl-5-hydroxy-6-metoxy-1,4-benzoquinol methylase